MPSCECGECKECKRRDYLRRWRIDNRERSREYQRRWREKHRERLREYQRTYQRAYRQLLDEEGSKKRQARLNVTNAVRDGRLERGACETCGSPGAQGHHDDYDRPLEVRWLCAPCHAAVHMEAA